MHDHFIFIKKMLHLTFFFFYLKHDTLFWVQHLYGVISFTYGIKILIKTSIVIKIHLIFTENIEMDLPSKFLVLHINIV